MRSPAIILLNGTSSSGKSTLAGLLHRQLAQPPRMLLALDDFFGFYRPEAFSDPDFFRDAIWPVVRGFHATIAALAAEQRHLIVDTVMQHPASFAHFQAQTAGLGVFCVGVRCSLPVLAQREHDRGDRRIGLAAHQLPLVHAHEGLAYDIEVRTDQATPAACAAAVLAALPCSDQTQIRSSSGGSRGESLR